MNPATHPHRPHNLKQLRKRTLDIAHAVILLLSVMLIAFISYDTFNNIPFLQNKAYMAFQLMVCMVFIADFFLELFLTPEGAKKGYLKARWPYLLLSIPFLNIIDSYDIALSPDALYFIRFIPLARGALALVIVLDYISANKITGIFVSYVSILLLTTYFAALIFYEREQPLNPHITNYWDAFIWCALQTTTLGSDIAPVTVAGKIISVILSFMGIIMYPLFTVYLSSVLVNRTTMLKFLNSHRQNVKTIAASGENTLPEPAKVAETDKKT